MTATANRPEESIDAPRARRPRRPSPAWLAADSPVLVWVGVVVALAGFALIAVAWAQVAGETQVYLQVPYLASAGLGGVGLIVVGATIVNVGVKRRDSMERSRQIEQLASILDEVRLALQEKGRRR